MSAKLKGFQGHTNKDGKAIAPTFEFNLVRRDVDGHPMGRVNVQAWGGEQLERDFNDKGEFRRN